MKSIKKYLGIFWILLACAVIWAVGRQALQEINSVHPAKYQETMLFWVIITLIFLPIMVGMILFGWYAFKGEYNIQK